MHILHSFNSVQAPNVFCTQPFKATPKSFGDESAAFVVSLSFALQKFLLGKLPFVFPMTFIAMPVVSLIPGTANSQIFIG